MEEQPPESIVLGDVIRLRIETEPVRMGCFRAWAPQWKGQEAFGVTPRGAVAELQYKLEALLSRNVVPTLYVSP